MVHTNAHPPRAALAARWVLPIAAVGVAAGDLAQIALLPWIPKHWGALGGAALYSAIAVGAVRDQRWADLLAVAIPVIPLGLLAATALGAPLPIRPDRAMLAILVLQLAAASAGGWRLAARRSGR